jgi:hypothetical protein
MIWQLLDITAWLCMGIELARLADWLKHRLIYFYVRGQLATRYQLYSWLIRLLIRRAKIEVDHEVHKSRTRPENR